MIFRPNIECRKSNFVNQRVGQSIEAEVNGFQVLVARFASLNPYVLTFLGGVIGQLVAIGFTARGTKEAAEYPLTEAKGALQGPASAFAFGAKDYKLRKSAANGAETSTLVGRFGKLSLQNFGKRLQTSAGEEPVEIGFIGRFGQEFSPCDLILLLEIYRGGAEGGRAVELDEGEKSGKAGQGQRIIDLGPKRNGWVDPLVDVFRDLALKFKQLGVEAQNVGCGWMLLR